MEALLKHRKQSFNDKRCKFPVDSMKFCEELAIQSHTIPRAGSLQKLAKNGHVYGFEVDFKTGRSKVVRIGVKKASTFTGFCSIHDSQSFRVVEQEPLLPTAEQLCLLGFRSVTRDGMMKVGMLNMLDMRETFNVRGPYLQFLDTIRAGAKIAAADYREELEAYSRCLLSRDFSPVRSLTLRTNNVPPIMCSLAVQPDVDFEGSRINLPGSIYDEVRARFIALNIMADSDKGGIIAFSWLHPNPAAQHLVESFLRVPESSRESAIVRYAFEFSENLYWSIPWWEGLPESDKARLVNRFEWTAWPGNERKIDALISDGAADGECWGVVEVSQNF